MQIKKIGGLYVVDNGDKGVLSLCPCCGAAFHSNNAAEAVVRAIEAEKFSWDLAMDLQEMSAMSWDQKRARS